MDALRILIADDESLRVMSLKGQLESLGHKVVAEASNGKEAIHLADELRPDLAILDIKMPEMDGIEAAQKIMAVRPIPIILLTAYSERELAERAASANVAAYLMKPVSEQDLLPAIALAVSRFKEFQSLHQEVDDLRDALETRKLIERAKGILMRRLGLSEEEAFRRLQRRSQNENKRLSEIAQAIITADGML
ncbi:MAG: response regulator [Anaerolineales bacterium]|nr:response regulator [Anaerolineales bacterium]